MDFRKIKIGCQKNDEIEEDDDENIVMLTEHEGLKTRLKDNKAF